MQINGIFPDLEKGLMGVLDGAGTTTTYRRSGPPCQAPVLHLVCDGRGVLVMPALYEAEGFPPELFVREKAGDFAYVPG
jgi:hypothetical protein